MQPFSDQIIFVDTEFSNFDPSAGELLSVGMIKLNGEEFYIETEYSGQMSGFVKSEVLPYLIGPKVSLEEAKKAILEFVGHNKPFMVGSTLFYDVVYLQKLFGFEKMENNPFNVKAIDFASILFGLGIDPEKDHQGKKSEFYQKFGIDKSKYKKHHALEDAKFLRDFYLKFLEQK
jgi:hypothetical protein